MNTASKNAKKTQATTSSKREPTAKPATFRKPRSAKPQMAASRAAPAKISKRDQLAAMLLRDEGATIEQLVTAMGWLPHTVRAALTGLKKRGYAIDSDKVDGLRTYRAIAPK